MCLALIGYSQDSYYRIYDKDNGLDAGTILALDQDRAGFLWLGTNAGVVRYDGRNFTSWLPDQGSLIMLDLCVERGKDALYARGADGRVWTRSGDDLLPVAGPSGEPVDDAENIACGGGSLWMIQDFQVWRQDQTALWHAMDRDAWGSEQPTHLIALNDETILMTNQAAWRIAPGQPPRMLLREPGLWLAAADGNGGYWLASHHGDGFWRLRDAEVERLHRPDGRALDMTLRGATLWLALDRYLLAYEADGRVREFATADGLPSGGPLLVDQERSLWLGTFVNLLQFPEPDTWHWGEREGLQSSHVRDLTLVDGRLWINSWMGLSWLDAAAPQMRVTPMEMTFGVLCAGATHDLWASNRDGIARYRNGVWTSALPSTDAVILVAACAQDAEGRVWFATSLGVFRSDPETGTLDAVDWPGPAAAIRYDYLWFDQFAGLWLAGGNTVCHHAQPENAAGGGCAHINAGDTVTDAVELDDGNFWLASSNGMLAFDGTHARRLPTSGELPLARIRVLAPSPDEGFWGAGPGLLARMQPCSTCASAVRELERPGGWQGLPDNGGIAVLETDDGALWIAGNRGVWRVPTQARAAPTNVPAVRLVKASIDTRELDPAAPIRMLPDDQQMHLEFAALTYRERSLLQFRSRRVGDRPWSSPTPHPALLLVDTPPGRYQLEMQASLDGVHWSSPAQVKFEVVPPWYLRAWAYALFAATAILLIVLLYRWRVRMLLRVERERSRIAMDLHDELGASLGSIGMLASVAARSDPASDQQRQLIGDIQSTAESLGSSLRSLVWSMRADRAGLGELAAQVVDGAHRLFPGSTPRLTMHLSQRYPARIMPVAVRRHTLLIVLEALHNAAVHADAAEVQLHLCAVGAHWRFEVRDDGCGFDSTTPSHGTGMSSMHDRARQIGAQLVVETRPGGGCRVSLDFNPYAAVSHDHALARSRFRADSGAK